MAFSITRNDRINIFIHHIIPSHLLLILFICRLQAAGCEVFHQSKHLFFIQTNKQIDSSEWDRRLCFCLWKKKENDDDYCYEWAQRNLGKRQVVHFPRQQAEEECHKPTDSGYLLNKSISSWRAIYLLDCVQVVCQRNAILCAICRCILVPIYVYKEHLVTHNTILLPVSGVEWTGSGGVSARRLGKQTMQLLSL